MIISDYLIYLLVNMGKYPHEKLENNGLYWLSPSLSLSHFSTTLLRQDYSPGAMVSREKETWSQVLSFSGILRYPEDSHPNFITRQQRGHAAPDWPEGRKKEARKQRLQGPVCRSWWKICIIMSMYSHLFQHT